MHLNPCTHLFKAKMDTERLHFFCFLDAISASQHLPSPCRSNTCSWVDILGMGEKGEWEATGAAFLSVGGSPGGAVRQGEPPPSQYKDNIKALCLVK